MATYKEKLLDPRWQKIRLLIMQRDEFSCQDCGETSRTLHVHHEYYEYNTEPWDYPDDALITVCDICHSKREMTDVWLRCTITSLIKKGTTKDEIVVYLEKLLYQNEKITA